ncbi:MAG TPA: ATP-binding protein [Chitinophagaceae bacterium]|nr:ATP-binding protein [Chitinophagaceae bacterium]
MFIGVKTKILLTVFAIVLLFTIFSLLYFPSIQGRTLLTNYKSEVQNQAKTIALGATIALSEQNFKGLQTAMDFVKENDELRFVTLMQNDTTWTADSSRFTIATSPMVTFPETYKMDDKIATSDSIIVMRAPIQTALMNGEIILGVSTQSIKAKQRKVRTTALLISGAIFLLGMLIGLWLSRSISHPVKALRTAARKVGEGDLTSEVKSHSKDEIGELAIAFNNMVKDIKNLSDLTLKQEKEKQEMLASQNEALEKQVAERTKELKTSLDHLKATQAQLVQSEKMASLGELTAGIAHEIQNPLNFVNNFSEINTELLDELKTAIDANDSAEIKDLIQDIKDNETKIVLHGKRADGIVKGMLQHSRSSAGQKEPSDINALCDEYLRLAYHGLRAKDKSFNVKMETDYDNTLEKINIVPQEIGRVILNIINNAFYAVSEMKKLAADSYQPLVSIKTRKLNDKIEILVSDNGGGIPDAIKEKIFQPFFTTKPTGSGTGLGLSLAYDIVKAHGGELKVDTKEAQDFPAEASAQAGSTFIIQLPA